MKQQFMHANENPTKSQCTQQHPQIPAKRNLEFVDPAAERQFQHHFAVSRRCWDVAAALVILALLPICNLAGLRSRVCSDAASTMYPSDQAPAWHLHPVLRSFPCAEGAAAVGTTNWQLPQLVWLARHWGPATYALYVTNNDLDGCVMHAGSIAALVWLLWARRLVTRGAAHRLQQQRTRLMTVWRLSKSWSALLVLLAFKMRGLPGWPQHTVVMYWGSSTMFGATRLLWQAIFLAVCTSFSL